VFFDIASYDGGLEAHPQAEKKGQLLLGSASRPLDWELHFKGSPEVFGEGLKYLMVASPTGPLSCLITMTDRDDPASGCTFELPGIGASYFNAKYAEWQQRCDVEKHARSQQVAMLIVTTNEISGYRITKVHGDVFGLTVRARNVFSNMGAQFHTVVGGEVFGYTKMLIDSRNEARERLWNGARAKGANAVIAMRFDCNEIGGIMSEIAAYGTAVTVEPLSEIVATALSEAQQAE